MTDKISISFDEDNRIRVLEADKFKQTDTLKNESMEFIKSNPFNYTIFFLKNKKNK